MQTGTLAVLPQAGVKGMTDNGGGGGGGGYKLPSNLLKFKQGL